MNERGSQMAGPWSSFGTAKGVLDTAVIGGHRFHWPFPDQDMPQLVTGPACEARHLLVGHLSMTPLALKLFPRYAFALSHLDWQLASHASFDEYYFDIGAFSADAAVSLPWPT